MGGIPDVTCRRDTDDLSVRAVTSSWNGRRGRASCAPTPSMAVATALAALSFGTLSIARSGAVQETGPRVIQILATRYAFDPAVLEVDVGEPVRLLLRSGDGVHGFSIAKLRITREIPRGGDPVVVDFMAADVGRFPIVCSEYCGNGHEDMKGTLVVRARGAGPDGAAQPDP
jgi:cytochrome c oxidase subunit 2